MKHLLLLLTLTVNLFLTSCQPEGFQDLSLGSFGTSFYFDSPAFSEALDNVEFAIPDTTYEIDRPEYLLPQPLFVREQGWVTTDTFAFEPGDFQSVLNVIISTAEAQKDGIQNSLVSSGIGMISLAGKPAWSVPGRYYLVPYHLSNGKRIYIQITRTKAPGSGFLTKWRYTACAVWMEGKVKEVKGDVS